MADTIIVETPVATVLEVSGLQGPQGPAGASQADVLTTQGDLLYRGASAAARLAIGTTGQVLKVSGGVPSWQNESGGVPTSRTITAGTGLTGGGDLSANRTLAVSYGTTAGTACQGNDGRIAGIESGSTTISSATVEIANAGISIDTADGKGELHTGDGGSIATNDGGGSIDTSNGGGAINTRGTGSIEFGIAGTRTTLTGTATADRAVSLPNAAGTLALTSDITKTAVGLGNVTNAAQVTSVSGTAPIVSSGGTTPTISVTTGTTAGTVAAGDHTHTQLHDRSHAITSTSDHTATANRVFYSNNSGQVTELALGAANTVLTSNGTTSAPSFAAVSAGATNLWIPASAWIPRTTTGCGVDSTELSTNKVNTDQLLFDTATEEYAQALVMMPSNYNNSTVTARFYWTASSGSGGVAFGLRGRAYADDDALDQAQGTGQVTTDTFIVANDLHVTAATSAITLAGTPAANRPVQFEIYRQVSNASDTLGVDARLLGVEVIFN